MGSAQPAELLLQALEPLSPGSHQHSAAGAAARDVAHNDCNAALAPSSPNLSSEAAALSLTPSELKDMPLAKLTATVRVQLQSVIDTAAGKRHQPGFRNRLFKVGKIDDSIKKSPQRTGFWYRSKDSVIGS